MSIVVALRVRFYEHNTQSLLENVIRYIFSNTGHMRTHSHIVTYSKRAEWQTGDQSRTKKTEPTRIEQRAQQSRAELNSTELSIEIKRIGIEHRCCCCCFCFWWWSWWWCGGVVVVAATLVMV